jgi:HPt (histidine-containing phosphotransfer) domain-containing protein
MRPNNPESVAPEAVAPEAVLDGDIVEESAVVDLARIDRLRASMPGKPSILAELVALFLKDLPLRLNAIGDAIARSDPAALALEAHALRGGSANFGARRLDRLCGDLEETGLRGALDAGTAIFAAVRCEATRVREALLALNP